MGASPRRSALPLSAGGKTNLASGALAPAVCTASGAGQVGSVSAASVTLTQRWSCRVDGASVTATVVDTFAAAARSISVDTVITTDKQAPFTAQLDTGLEFAELNPGSSFWLPFGKGCVQNSGKNHGSTPLHPPTPFHCIHAP